MVASVQKPSENEKLYIPREILNAVNWKSNENLVIKTVGDKIIIEKAKTRKNIKEIFSDAGFTGRFVQPEIDWGEPVGDEVW